MNSRGHFNTRKGYVMGDPPVPNQPRDDRTLSAKPVRLSALKGRGIQRIVNGALPFRLLLYPAPTG